MRKRFTTSLFAVLCLALLVPMSAFADVRIDATNFPDPNFRSYLLEQEYGQDGVITDAEIEEVTDMYVYDLNITSLEGIQHFTALTTLWCSDNKLTNLDVSGCTALISLDCSYNLLSSLDVSNCMALKALECQVNQLASLDVSKNTTLTLLDCDINQLSSLDVSNNTALITLYCTYNQLTELDVSNCTALTSLSCGGNYLTSLDVSKNTALTFLNCYRNKIKDTNMNALINSLPNSKGRIDIYDSISETEGNVCTKNQVAALKEKGWTPYYDDGYEWVEYEGADDATGINSAEVGYDSGVDANAKAYDLNGNRVEDWQSKKGIYIIGGRKVVVK